MKTKVLSGVFLFLLFSSAIQAQDKKNRQRFHLSSSIGVNKIQGPLNRTFRHSLAIHSGIERKIRQKWILAVDLGFNTIQYEQQKRDVHSDYLFKNTRSSFIVVGLNVGFQLLDSPSRFQCTPYLGAGYVNTGEPRVTVSIDEREVHQQIVRHGGLLGRLGSRFSFRTHSTVLQTIFIDCSYWSSTVRLSDQRIRSVSIFTGMRMKM